MAKYKLQLIIEMPDKYAARQAYAYLAGIDPSEMSPAAESSADIFSFSGPAVPCPMTFFNPASVTMSPAKIGGLQ